MFTPINKKSLSLNPERLDVCAQHEQVHTHSQVSE